MLLEVGYNHIQIMVTVTWGSLDRLTPYLTVRDMEDFAAHVAAAAINEDRKKRS